MSAAPGVSALRSVELGVRDLEPAVRFYCDVWLLTEVARDGDAVYLRGTGPEHHLLVLRAAPRLGLQRINLAAPNAAAVDDLCARVARHGAAIVARPAALAEPGGGYGFAFDDGEGREFRVVAGVASHAALPHRADLPAKLSHVVLNSATADTIVALFCDALGFRLRDQTDRANFLGCNADHHSLAFGRVGGTALNHVAYEVPTLDGEMRAAGRLKRGGVPIEWGVGRHGPGSNVFCYVVDPSGYAIEYTTEMAQIDDAAYTPGTPETWKRAPHSDAWGLAEPPTQRFRDAITGRLLTGSTTESVHA